jgi:mannose-6-phosphate isomerase-like protein (cupin superfamily)
VTGAPLGCGQEGTLTLAVAGTRHQVGPGQCARFPGSVPHSYAGAGTGPVRLTMVVVVPPAPA